MQLLALIHSLLDLRPVQYLLLVLAAGLLVVTGYSVIRQKSLAVSLDIEKSRNAEYAAAAKVAQGQREALEKAVAVSGEEIKRIQADYATRLDRLSKNRITSTACADMVAESVKLLQGGEE